MIFNHCNYAKYFFNTNQFTNPYIILIPETPRKDRGEQGAEKIVFLNKN